jgi:hypothetical protein
VALVRGIQNASPLASLGSYRPLSLSLGSRNGVIVSLTLVAWLIEPEPFEAAIPRFVEANPSIPEAFYPDTYLEDSQFCCPQIDTGMTQEDEYFFTSPRVHAGFCEVLKSLTRLVCTNKKRWRRSGNFQSLRSFVAPFLFCAPYSPWNEYGLEYGAAFSPQALRALLRYREMFDSEAFQSDYSTRREVERWGEPYPPESEFDDYGRFVSYVDRMAARAREAIQSERALYIAIF